MYVEPNDNNALVFDLGSVMFRGGYAGCGFPDINMPSAAFLDKDSDTKYIIPENGFSRPSKLDINYMVDSESFAINNEILTSLLNFTNERLGLNPDEPNKPSALFTQPAHLVGDKNFGSFWRSTIAQIGFENMGYENISVTSDATLAAYAHCFFTATVVDFGWSCTRVIPVIEGKPLYENAQVNIFGGLFMSQILSDRLSDRGIPLAPLNAGTKAQAILLEREAAADIIKQACFFNRSEEFVKNAENIAYHNGKLIDVRTDMEILSQLPWRRVDIDDTTVLPLQQLCEAAVYPCPAAHKKQLWANMVTAGGFSSLDGFQTALLASFAGDRSFERKVHCPMHEAVRGGPCVWTGGSILASSSFFPRFCVSRAEYQEYGENIMAVKCV